MNTTTQSIYMEKQATKTTCFSGSKAVIETLLREGVDTVFGYPGGTIMPVYDALYDYRNRLNHILVRHEQGALHAAQGYARVSGRPGVCIVTSGPGATNTVTGLADAMMDSTPVVLISGQVGSGFLGTDAFQETNFVGITQAVTKWNCQVRHAADIPAAIAKAFYIARTGRPGPVVVDITKDAQQEMAEYHYEKVSFIRSYCPSPAIDKEKIAEAAKLINLSRKPLALIGQGVILGGAEKELRVFLEKSGIPAASTLLGLSAIPSDHPQFVGMLGMHGNYAPNIKNKECDLLIAIGMRFDDRVTGNPEQFGINAKIIHLEIDPAEVNKIIYADVPVLGNVKETLPALTELVVPNRHTDWIAEFKACYNIEYQEIIEPALYPTSKQIRMGEVVDLVSKAYHHDAILVTDVGQQQMVASRYFRFKPVVFGICFLGDEGQVQQFYILLITDFINSIFIFFKSIICSINIKISKFIRITIVTYLVISKNCTFFCPFKIVVMCVTTYINKVRIIFRIAPIIKWRMSHNHNLCIT